MRKGFKIFLYVLAILLFQELVFRICFPVPEVLNFNRSNYIPKPDGVETIEPMRYERKTFQSFPDTNARFVHKLNGYGFRDKEWSIKKEPNKTRIMFIGDSFTEGAMASEGQTITDAFKFLASDTIETMNLGIIGAGLAEYTPLINDAIPLFKPDYLFLVLFSNDISNRKVGIPEHTKPKYSKAYTPRLWVLIQMLMNKEPLPLRWKGASSFMPAIPDPLNLWTTQEAEFSQHVKPEFAEYMKAGNYNTFRINYAAAEEHYLKTPVGLKPYLNWVKGICTENNTRLVVCYIPSRQQVTTYYYPYELPTCLLLCPDSMDLTTTKYQIHRQELNTNCEQLGVPFIDLTSAIKAEENKGKHIYWNYDDHMRAKGYQLVGETIYKEWKK